MNEGYSPFAQDAIQVLDGMGTFVFAISGGLLGLRKRFDFFGVLVLASVTAMVGGIVRDVLIGAVPPAALAEIHSLLIALAGGLLTFAASPRLVALQRPILLFDALGLATFAVIGTEKAIHFGLHPVMAAVLGMITGIGGGVLRDMLAGETPFVLRKDLYASAALAAAAVVALGNVLGLPPLYPMLAGLAACVFLRVMAIYRGWRLPTAPGGGEPQE